MTYLIVDDTSNAFFLWKRIPKSLKSASEPLLRMWEIARGLYNSKSEYAFDALKKAKLVCKGIQSSLCDTLHARMMERSVSLISRAYTIVALESVAKMLGLDKEGAKAYCVDKLGWEYEASSDMLKPKAVKEGDRLTSRGLDHLSHLTNCVSFLESKKTSDVDYAVLAVQALAPDTASKK
eukprot:g2025.t1